SLDSPSAMRVKVMPAREVGRKRGGAARGDDPPERGMARNRRYFRDLHENELALFQEGTVERLEGTPVHLREEAERFSRRLRHRALRRLAATDLARGTREPGQVMQSARQVNGLLARDLQQVPIATTDQIEFPLCSVVCAEPRKNGRDL